MSKADSLGFSLFLQIAVVLVDTVCFSSLDVGLVTLFLKYLYSLSENSVAQHNVRNFIMKGYSSFNR